MLNPKEFREERRVEHLVPNQRVYRSNSRHGLLYPLVIAFILFTTSLNG
jgi:hypothetical protein